MSKIKNKKSPLKFFITAVVCICLVITIVPRVKTIMELSARKQELEIKKAELQKKNNELKQEYKMVNSPENIEKIAREQLGMVKDGEQLMVQVIPGKTN